MIFFCNPDDYGQKRGGEGGDGETKVEKAYVQGTYICTRNEIGQTDAGRTEREKTLEQEVQII